MAVAKSPDRDPRIGVVIITHQRRRELLRTLKHLTALPERPPIVVVDNASTDGTADAVAAEFPEAVLVRAGANLGAVGRNIGAEALDTPYVAFADDDTWWEPGSLALAADLLDAHPDVASLTARILVEPQGVEDPITPELRHSPVPGRPGLPGPALLGVLAGASVLRLSAFRQVGGFHERLWLGGEEELLSLDLAAAGWWLCWIEDMVVHHAPSRGRDSTARRRLGIRNTLWTAWLRRPAPAALRRTAAVLGAVPRDTASAAAVGAALAGLPWVLAQRRPVPARVEEGLRLLEEPQKSSPARRYVG
ncbi:glycosyltransferase family 2 protein [Streptomonospora nanhaiensis]|uniref:glycosyltransferase family 2 protein n=1 Tax=Streptomonospora nanhaiensis TaxID=1323731 RepID=UPI001C38D6F0|nr:glycosyltransferase [Streptomonospora nanhaiensis]MBV2366384.1 glycosyltransferase [Streptomonospora nanhaiensis]MBX9388984.1 glycosyltransferase [Streptomonospora nanhaiensis]